MNYNRNEFKDYLNYLKNDNYYDSKYYERLLAAPEPDEEPNPSRLLNKDLLSSLDTNKSKKFIFVELKTPMNEQFECIKPQLIDLQGS